jgi:catechol 2,3-dioxygenase-like lactoylglutathione lyase family enzyme
VRVTGPDHIVLVSPDPERLVNWYVDELGLSAERLEEWRRGEVFFVSLRASSSFLIDVLPGERSGVNMDHIALVVDDADLDALAASGRFDVEMGPADLFGAQGMGRGIYIRDPDGNKVELRSYS